MIPVADARVAKAYQCPWTKTIYATKKSYVNHLKSLRTKRMHQTARKNRWNRLGENLWNQNSFANIVNWIELHPEWFLDNGAVHTTIHNNPNYEKIRSNFSLNITHLKLTWSDKVSNSHSCPHTGHTNWCGKKPDVPRGYPGWQGQIEFISSHNIPGVISDFFKDTRIHLGSGGSGGNLKYNYEVKFFEADWPGLSKMRTWSILDPTVKPDFQFGKSSSRY